jgi:hypothetical protein
MTSDDTTNAPTTEDFAKALFELSIITGILMSRAERMAVQQAARELVCRWTCATGKPVDLTSTWCKDIGPIMQASRQHSGVGA